MNSLSLELIVSDNDCTVALRESTWDCKSARGAGCGECLESA